MVFCSSIRMMCSSLVRRVITLLLAQSLFFPIASAQQQETRPRRAQPVWTPPSATTPVIPETPPLRIATGPEPKIRVALSTDSRSAVISTTGHLMNASGDSSTLLALDTARVRVDPRLLSPRQNTPEDATFQ